MRIDGFAPNVLDAVLAAGFPVNVVITGGTGLHDLTVAEHALALTLAAARRLNLLVRAQIGHRWAGELGGLQPVDDPTSFRTLRGARVLIWGFGGIAATLAPYLTDLNRIRREHPALGQLRNIDIHWSDDSEILVYSKYIEGRFTPSGSTTSA